MGAPAAPLPPLQPVPDPHPSSPHLDKAEGVGKQRQGLLSDGHPSCSMQFQQHLQAVAQASNQVHPPHKGTRLLSQQGFTTPAATRTASDVLTLLLVLFAPFPKAQIPRWHG